MREIVAKNNVAILRRICDQIRISEPLEISKAYDDKVYNQKIK